MRSCGLHIRPMRSCSAGPTWGSTPKSARSPGLGTTRFFPPLNWPGSSRISRDSKRLQARATTLPEQSTPGLSGTSPAGVSTSPMRHRRRARHCSTLMNLCGTTDFATCTESRRSYSPRCDLPIRTSDTLTPAFCPAASAITYPSKQSSLISRLDFLGRDVSTRAQSRTRLEPLACSSPTSGAAHSFSPE